MTDRQIGCTVVAGTLVKYVTLRKKKTVINYTIEQVS